MTTLTEKASTPGTHRVIVLDNIAAEGMAALEAAANIEYEIQTGLSGDALREALSQFKRYIELDPKGVKVPESKAR